MLCTTSDSQKPTTQTRLPRIADQIVHSELKEIFNHLKLHLWYYAEQSEAGKNLQIKFYITGL